MLFHEFAVFPNPIDVHMTSVKRKKFTSFKSHSIPTAGAIEDGGPFRLVI